MKRYESNWESINSRPVPQWFQDAKFGIFIHWGLYSVPAYNKKGSYTEWYQHALNQEGSPTQQFHERVYGKDFKYQDFVKDFKAELFDAEEWAQLFKNSGAKYINLVSKHHDGFCMYKTDYAWNWNSFDVGPHRDFCAELKKAVEKVGVRFGVYHSVYEWYNPLYLKDPEEYALKHFIPMMKELVEKYQPWTIFTDGEWEQSDTVWHSTQLLEWLYNESSVRDFVVPNDRWGKGTRGKNGGNFTTEYGSIGTEDKVDLNSRYREECRGIGASFGLNRIENTDDYLSAKELVDLLVDLVSSGSNLLLNIGPAADGTIPVIMQERLLQLGKWLSVNGEGIYCSKRYKDSTQKDVCYTQRDGSVYAFFKHFPMGEKVLEDIEYRDDIKLCLLGSSVSLQAENEGGRLKVKFPPINPDELDSEYVYTLKIS